MRPISFLKVLFDRSFLSTLVALGSFVALGFVLRDFLGIFLTTFLFAYLFGALAEGIVGFIHRRIDRIPHKGRRPYLSRVGFRTVVTVIYVVFISVCAFVIATLVPRFVLEFTDLVRALPDLAARLQLLLERAMYTLPPELWFASSLESYIDPSQFENIGAHLLQYLKNLSLLLTHFFIALLLSYIFLIDQIRIQRYLAHLRDGNFAFIYHEYAAIFGKLSRAFGLIFRAQSVIALVNTFLTVLGMVAIAYIFTAANFPYLLTLALIIFILGFIPVIGTFISSVPIFLIAFGFGGVSAAVAIAILIIVIHMIEAYYLNPKIVSAYTDFPVFITFLILLASEHFFGLIGFLIGIPVFLIAIDLLRDIDRFITQLRLRLIAYQNRHPEEKG